VHGDSRKSGFPLFRRSFLCLRDFIHFLGTGPSLPWSNPFPISGSNPLVPPRLGNQMPRCPGNRNRLRMVPSSKGNDPPLFRDFRSLYRLPPLSGISFRSRIPHGLLVVSRTRPAPCESRQISPPVISLPTLLAVPVHRAATSLPHLFFCEHSRTDPLHN